MDMGNIGLKDVFVENHTHSRIYIDIYIYIYIYSVIVFGSWKMHGSVVLKKNTIVWELKICFLFNYSEF